MAVELEQFIRQLEETGILAAETLHDFLPPKKNPKDAQELARELVRQKKLSVFQAEAVYRGRGKSLILDNYILLEKIGQGGMGQVFKARHRRLDRLVAVKLLAPIVVKDPAAVARFQREVLAAAKITHPHIVAALDAGCTNGAHFLVMEFVDGSDLAAVVKKQGPLPVNHALHYLLQTAQGLTAAHAAGIVHRDIKPANLLLEQSGTVKILDMGLVRLLDDAPGQPELTTTGAVMGTVDYIAPEQALNTKSADARADIYSLGCSFHYLLTGRAPYAGDSMMAKLLAHREQPIPALRAARPDVTDAVEAIYQKMMAKSVVDRYQTMDELIADLSRLARGEPPAARPPETAFANSTGDAGLADFLKDISAESAAPRDVPVRVGSGTTGGSRNRRWYFLAGGVIAFLTLLAGLAFSQRAKSGTLVVQVPESGTRVEVLDVAGNVEFSRKIKPGTITLSVAAGNHRLAVTKEGFETFTREFEIDGGRTHEIAAEMVAVDDDSVGTFANLFLDFHKPEFAEWQKRVSGLPAEQQIKEVAERLRQVNRGFEPQSEFGPTLEGGAVIAVKIQSDVATDLSPLRALTGLKELTCYGRNPTNALADLSPLRGMKLTTFRLGWSQVSDLSPIAGMPLTYLECHSLKVSDLTPLRKLPLVGFQCRSPRVSDLTPLQGMKLVTFECLGTQVADLSLLAEMPLKEIKCDFVPGRDSDLLRSIKSLETINYKPAAEFWKDLPAVRQAEQVIARLRKRNPRFEEKATYTIVQQKVTALSLTSRQVTDLSPVRELTGLQLLQCGAPIDGKPEPAELADLSPLKGTALKELAFSNTRVADLTPLLGLPLASVTLDRSPVRDLSPLREAKLTYLHANQTLVADLAPLKGLPLQNISLIDCAEVADLSPLGGAPLLAAEFSGTQIADLAPLKGMPLHYVGISRTRVIDLTPLAGMRLDTITFNDTSITDLSPLQGMPLVRINLDFDRQRDTSLLRSFKSLESINNRPVAEFWKEIDAP